jgi:hypothetical protein
MSVSLSPILNGFQSFLATGLPNNAGFINTYLAGSSTPAATYTTSAGNVANANPIVLTAGGFLANEVWLTDGVSYKFVITDSASNIIQTLDNVSSTKTIYDFHVFITGKPAASQYLFRVPMIRAMTFNVGLISASGTLAYATASAAATASYTLSIAKNGTPFGTVVYALGATTGTITAATPPSLAPGDVLSVQAPATPDATLADIGIIFNATLS